MSYLATHVTYPRKPIKPVSDADIHLVTPVCHLLTQETVTSQIMLFSCLRSQCIMQNNLVAFSTTKKDRDEPSSLSPVYTFRNVVRSSLWII